MNISSQQLEANLKACSDLVEAVLTRVGFDPAASRMTSESGPAWGIASGSAEVFIFITTAEQGENYIQVVSPVMRPGADTARLFERLLELNGSEVTGAAFGMRDRNVVLCTDRSTVGLDRHELEEMIRRVSDYADYYDDILTVEFGGTRFSDLPPDQR